MNAARRKRPSFRRTGNGEGAATHRRFIVPVEILASVLMLLLGPVVAASSAGISSRYTRPSAVAPAPTIVGQAAFLMDDTTGRALYAYHADSLRYPASTIKMLTAIVCARRLNPATVVTVPNWAIVDPSIYTSARLYVGERLTVRDLLYGLLLPSGNDAATTLAGAAAGSNQAFVRLMNAEAGRLHLWYSHALGATGVDSVGQYTTARDLAWLAHALLSNSLLAGIVRTRTYQARSVDGRYWHAWSNLNRLLWAYPGAIGVKTGTTPLAGANLVAAANIHNHRIIAVVLGSTAAARFSDGAKLLDFGRQMLGGGLL